MFKRRRTERSATNDDLNESIDETLDDGTSDTTMNEPTNQSTASTDEILAQIELLKAKLLVSENRQKESEGKIETLNNSLNSFQVNSLPTEYKDIITQIPNAESIQLEPYKCIPEFTGNKNQYRSWREQVVRRMETIREFKESPKYEAALGIIRAKISGAASDVLINNNTAYNIDAIIDRLDFSYADQRPLYVVEAELTSIKQSGKSLQEYYDAINQALNTVITKIVMTYKRDDEQKSLINETQLKAIRTFIMGLNSSMMRSTLYGHEPKTLSKAFAIAQTVYYDNQHLQLERNRETSKLHGQQQPKRNPNFDYSKPQYHAQKQANVKPEAMDVDESNRYKQSNNWRKPEQNSNEMKREVESSRQYTQPNQKKQRVYQLQDDREESLAVEASTHIPDDLISNASCETTTASAFLEE